MQKQKERIMYSTMINNGFSNDFFEGQSLFPTALFPLGNFLMKFSEQATFPVSVRAITKSHRIQDMKIIMHNKASADNE